MTKRALSETEICDRFITPALQQAGWLLERMRREYSFTDGRIIVRGRLVSRGRRKRADYLLVDELQQAISRDPLFIGSPAAPLQMLRDGRAVVVFCEFEGLVLVVDDLEEEQPAQL